MSRFAGRRCYQGNTRRKAGLRLRWDAIAEGKRGTNTRNPKRKWGARKEERRRAPAPGRPDRGRYSRPQPTLTITGRERGGGAYCGNLRRGKEYGPPATTKSTAGSNSKLRSVATSPSWSPPALSLAHVALRHVAIAPRGCVRQWSMNRAERSRLQSPRPAPAANAPMKCWPSLRRRRERRQSRERSSCPLAQCQYESALMNLTVGAKKKEHTQVGSVPRLSPNPHMPQLVR